MAEEKGKVKREYWGTRLGVILAVAGSAVGLGNFLRFPGLAAKYDGGVFMIPYFISLLIIGIPICWCEWTLGRYGGRHGHNSSPGIFNVIINRRWGHYVGVISLLVPVVIYMYYVYIESWCLAYAWQYATGEIIDHKRISVELARENLPAQTLELPDNMRYNENLERLFLVGPMSEGQREDLLVAAPTVEAASAVKRLYAVSNTPGDAYGAHFENYVGMWSDGVLTSTGISESVVFLVLVFLLNFFLIYRGLNKGIEFFCKIAMPLLIVAAIVILVRVLTLGTPDPAKPDLNVLNGLGFMWNVDAATLLPKLANPNMWLEAAGQVFFSLSVGFGIILTYASYVRSRDDVILSGLTSSSMNEFCEVILGGLITIPAAFIFLGATPIAAVAGSTLGLGFYTFPAIFEFMPLGRAFGFLWFFLLFLAAVTSSISMLQPAIAFLEEGLNLGRRASVAIMGLVTAIGALVVVYFSRDLMALDIMDFWVGQVLIFVLGTVLVIIFGWVFGINRVWKEAHRGAHIRIPGIYKYIIVWISPVYLLVIFGFFLYENAFRGLAANEGYIAAVRENPSAQYTVWFLLILAAFFLLLIHIAGLKWRDRPVQHIDEEVDE